MQAGLAKVVIGVNVVFCVLGIVYFGDSVLSQDRTIEYKDLITIILTAIAVILAGVTIFIGVLAIWGYSTIKDSSVRAAKEAAETVARDVLSKVPPIAAREAAEVVASRMDDSLARALQEGGPDAQ